jgi:protease I
MPYDNKVALIIANVGYQQIEYSVPKHIIEAAGIGVETVSDKPGIATAKDNSTTTVDVTLNELDVTHYKAILFIGGPGALEHLDNETSYKIIQDAIKSRKIVGAICAATRILAKADALEGKKATGWNGDDELEKIYKEHGATFMAKNVVTDGNIITAVGPDAAQEFGQAILQVLPVR